MAVISCPYCGSSLNVPLKFCVACGRAVTQSDVKKAGGLKNAISTNPNVLPATKRLEDNLTSSSFDLARKSYGLQRSFRQLFVTVAFMIFCIIVYYLTVKYILKEPLPFEMEAHIQHILQSIPQGNSAPDRQ